MNFGKISFRYWNVILSDAFLKFYGSAPEGFFKTFGEIGSCVKTDQIGDFRNIPLAFE